MENFKTVIFFYKRWYFTRGSNGSDLTVVAYGRWSHTEVRLYRMGKIFWLSVRYQKKLFIIIYSSNLPVLLSAFISSAVVVVVVFC